MSSAKSAFVLVVVARRRCAMMRIRFGMLIVFAGLAICQASQPAVAQVYSPSVQTYGRIPSPMRSMSGIVSGYEAWQLHEIRRRSEIGRQVDLNADMYSGAGSQRCQ